MLAVAERWCGDRGMAKGGMTGSGKKGRESKSREGMSGGVGPTRIEREGMKGDGRRERTALIYFSTIYVLLKMEQKKGLYIFLRHKCTENNT